MDFAKKSADLRIFYIHELSALHQVRSFKRKTNNGTHWCYTVPGGSPGTGSAWGNCDMSLCRYGKIKKKFIEFKMNAQISVSAGTFSIGSQQ